MKFNNIRIMIPILFSLIFIYAISLIFIYTLPSVNAPDNISQSHKIFNEEGNYRVLSTEFKSQTQLDNFTDLRIMVPRSASSDNPSFAAIDMGGYSRYWHGYQVVLRPLISFFNYEQVRFLLSTLLISLLCVSSSLIWKRMGLVYSICFVVSMCFVHIEAIGMSVQFSSVFFIAMISSIFILKSDRYDDGIIGRLGIPAFFMIIGSVTNFFDLLTAPLLTLTLPLSILIIINDDVTLTNLKTIVITSISWSVGYALTWISKWIISYLFISHSAISDAINQIFFRSMGSEKYPLHRDIMLRDNFVTMFLDYRVAILIVLVFICALIILKSKELGKAISLISISAMPYVWYMALSNHSQIHFWFTFRSQMPTMFCFLVVTVMVSKRIYIRLRK